MPRSDRNSAPKSTTENLRALVAAATKSAAATKKEAEKLLRRAKRLESASDAASHAFGRELAKLTPPAIHQALGAKSFDALLRAHFTLSPRQADKLVAAAPAYARKIFDQLGLERAHALVRYVALTPEKDVAETLARLDAEIDGRRISESSVTDLERAIAKLRPPKKRTPEERAAARAAAQAQRAARQKGAKKATARATRDGGTWYLDIRIPLDQAAKLGLV